MIKRVINQIENLTIIIKRKTNSCQQSQKPVKTNEKYFNYGKKGHYAWDYCSKILKRKPEDKKTSKEGKQTWQKRNQVTKKAITIRSANQDQNNSNSKPYPADNAFISRNTDDKDSDT